MHQAHPHYRQQSAVLKVHHFNIDLITQKTTFHRNIQNNVWPNIWELQSSQADIKKSTNLLHNIWAYKKSHYLICLSHLRRSNLSTLTRLAGVSVPGMFLWATPVEAQTRIKDGGFLEQLGKRIGPVHQSTHHNLTQKLWWPVLLLLPKAAVWPASLCPIHPLTPKVSPHHQPHAWHWKPSRLHWRSQGCLSPVPKHSVITGTLPLFLPRKNNNLRNPPPPSSPVRSLPPTQTPFLQPPPYLKSGEGGFFHRPGMFCLGFQNTKALGDIRSLFRFIKGFGGKRRNW